MLLPWSIWANFLNLCTVYMHVNWKKLGNCAHLYFCLVKTLYHIWYSVLEGQGQIKSTKVKHFNYNLLAKFRKISIVIIVFLEYCSYTYAMNIYLSFKYRCGMCTFSTEVNCKWCVSSATCGQTQASCSDDTVFQVFLLSPCTTLLMSG